MTITNDQAKRLQEIAAEMAEQLREFKQICRKAMTPNEYQLFKYRCLGHLEPALQDDTEWVTTYSDIDPLEKVAQNAFDMANDEEKSEQAGG